MGKEANLKIKIAIFSTHREVSLLSIEGITRMRNLGLTGVGAGGDKDASHQLKYADTPSRVRSHGIGHSPAVSGLAAGLLLSFWGSRARCSRPRWFLTGFPRGKS